LLAVLTMRAATRNVKIEKALAPRAGVPGGAQRPHPELAMSPPPLSTLAPQQAFLFDIM